MAENEKIDRREVIADRTGWLVWAFLIGALVTADLLLGPMMPLWAFWVFGSFGVVCLLVAFFVPIRIRRILGLLLPW